MRKRELDGQVVEQDPGAGLEGHRVGQCEHPLGGQCDDFGHPARQHGQGQHPVTGADVSSGGGAAHHTGDLGARGERKLRLVLIEPAGEQGVRECDPGGVDVDHHRIGTGGFFDLGHPHCVGTVESGDLCCTHRCLLRWVASQL